MQLLPNSDAPPHRVVTLHHKGKTVEWPLQKEMLSMAILVQPASEWEDTPSIVARSPIGDLTHVNLKTGATTKFDSGVGGHISAAQNGCCVVYMVGGMAQQLTLRIARTDDGDNVEVQSIQVESSAWSPVISPDGKQVVYTTITPDGNAGQIYLRDIFTDTSKILADNTKNFPSGPRPPPWTDKGIYFTGLTGEVSVLDLQGRIERRSEVKVDGILLDPHSGNTMNLKGEAIEVAR